jgi:hypothetical protein
MDEKAKTVFLHQLKGKKYEPGISLITPSGDRPNCIERCKYYIERQTYKGPLQWIISDDSTNHYNISCPRNVSPFLYTHNKRKYPGNKSDSFRCNVITALPYIVFDKIIIIEDDDWYSPNYIKVYHDRLLSWELVGEGPARYYDVTHRLYRILGNSKRASFCQTAIQSKIIEKLFVSCQRDSAFVDSRLWNKHCNRKIVFQDKAHCIGIKNMPGRRGIGMGHRLKSGTKDKEWKILSNWIGQEDTEFYKQFAI